jgi:uncharacterized protein (DUF362 family)
MKKKSVVALTKEETIQESVSKVFDLLGGVENMLEPNAVIVLKPNAGHSAPPESSVDTNPEVVRAVIHEIRKANPKRIIIAESAAVGCDTMAAFESCGIKKIAEEEGVELIDIKKEKDMIDIPIRNYKSNIKRIKLPRFLLEADHIINLPILKAHASMVFSGALKNIKGSVQDFVHIQMHQQNLTMAMMDVWYGVRPDINILDVWNPAGGFGPHTPVPLHVGCIMGSYDPVALDLIACELVGINIDDVDYFHVAAEAGFGTMDRDNIEIVGEKVEDCYKKLWIPYIGGMNRWPEYPIYSEGACSSCQAMLALSMETLKAIGVYEERKDTVVVIGGKNHIPEDIPDEKIILHGNCTKKYSKEHPNAIWIKGCPPAEPCLYSSVSERVQNDAQSEENVAHLRALMAEHHPIWESYVEAQAEKFYKEHH